MMNAYAQRVLQERIINNFPWEKEFIQSVTEVFESLGPLAPVEPGDCARLDERWEIQAGSTAQRASESTVSK